MDSPDQPLGGFEERLLTQLKEVVVERSGSPHRTVARAGSEVPAAAGQGGSRPRRRLALALGAALVLAAVGAVTGGPLPGLTESSAYAVERDPDGSIRVYIRDYRDPKGLERRIESFGVPAAVDYVPGGTTCREPRGDFVPPEQMPLEMVSWGPYGDEGNYYWKLYPRYIKPGQTFVYVVQLSPHSQRAVIRLANGPVAPCDPVPVG